MQGLVCAGRRARQHNSDPSEAITQDTWHCTTSGTNYNLKRAKSSTPSPPGERLRCFLHRHASSSRSTAGGQAPSMQSLPMCCSTDHLLRRVGLRDAPRPHLCRAAMQTAALTLHHTAQFAAVQGFARPRGLFHISLSRSADNRSPCSYTLPNLLSNAAATANQGSHRKQTLVHPTAQL